MFKILVWLRRADRLSPEEFRTYWVQTHAPLVRRTYTRLRTYAANVVTRSLGTDAPFDGIAELIWASRDDFNLDVRQAEARAVMDDMARFTATSGTVFVDEETLSEE